LSPFVVIRQRQRARLSVLLTRATLLSDGGEHHLRSHPLWWVALKINGTRHSMQIERAHVLMS
jgi:hypothetical protein